MVAKKVGIWPSSLKNFECYGGLPPLTRVSSNIMPLMEDASPIVSAEPKSVDTETLFRNREFVLKEKELALRIRELELKENDQRYSRWLNPLFLGLIAASVTLIGNILVTKQQTKATLEQERLKSQSSLILEAIKTGDTDRAATNLSFFIQLGFIDDPQGRVKAFIANRQNVPVLPSPLQQAMSKNDFPGIVLQITQALGEQPSFTVITTDSGGIAAYMEDGRRVLRIDRSALAAINKNKAKNWGSVFMLAHEIGHFDLGHLDGPMNIKNLKEMELQADNFAGFVCYRLGASLDEVTQAVQAIPSRSEDSFPQVDERVKAATNGWTRAQAQNPK